MSRFELSLRVVALEWQAKGVLSMRLSDAAGGPLPAYEPGAHIELAFEPGLSRSYSLMCGLPQETPNTYEVAVALDPRSRGGSRHVHEKLRPGDVIAGSLPRNHFPLTVDSPFTQLIGGGIGVTPLMAMAERLTSLGRDWRLRWCVRDLEHLPFRDWLAKHRDRIDLHVDARDGGVWNDWESMLAPLPAGAHLYCCGPAPMLQAYEQATAGTDPERVHLERFGAEVAPQTSDGASFVVRLARDGRQVSVGPDQTILDALASANVAVPSSCLQGVCGVCETRVLDGVPDHRDHVLTAAERERGATIMLCCSRARTPELLLDL